MKLFPNFTRHHLITYTNQLGWKMISHILTTDNLGFCDFWSSHLWRHKWLSSSLLRFSSKMKQKKKKWCICFVQNRIEHSSNSTIQFKSNSKVSSMQTRVQETYIELSNNRMTRKYIRTCRQVKSAILARICPLDRLVVGLRWNGTKNCGPFYPRVIP